MAQTQKIFCMVPTFNESENIAQLIHALFALELPAVKKQTTELHVLVVDDDSPDGTSSIVKSLMEASQNPRLHLMTRTTKRGRGTAGIDGFQEALRLGADAVIEMDADFSHDPKEVPHFVESFLKGAPIVIGSRFIAGGSDMDRGPLRRITTLCAHNYIRLLLQLGIKDVTSGYRLFSRQALESISLSTLRAQGPEILQESLLRAVRKGFIAVEIPITFVDRRLGTSKLNLRKLFKVLFSILRLRFSGDFS